MGQASTQPKSELPGCPEDSVRNAECWFALCVTIPERLTTFLMRWLCVIVHMLCHCLKHAGASNLSRAGVQICRNSKCFFLVEPRKDDAKSFVFERSSVNASSN